MANRFLQGIITIKLEVGTVAVMDVAGGDATISSVHAEAFVSRRNEIGGCRARIYIGGIPVSVIVGATVARKPSSPLLMLQHSSNG